MVYRRLFVLLLALSWSPAVQAAEDLLELRILDVGQGDAILIRNGGKVALVDTGPTDAIVSKLRVLGIDALDLLVISHNHMDHLGGADALLAAMPVRYFMDNGVPAKTKIQETVLRLVEAKQIPYLTPTAREIALGDATLTVLPPLAHPTRNEQNDVTVGILVSRGKFRALLPGDAEVEALKAWVADGRIPDVDLLKAAHHGSRNGVTPQLLVTAKPEVVVISVAAVNDYGHPHAAALKLYATAGRKLWRTDELGDVVAWVAPDGAYTMRATRDHVVPLAVPPPASEAVSAPVKHVPPAVVAPACCRICRSSVACGDACIGKGQQCAKPRGCACNG